jgi:hypothetical protein
MPAAGGSAHRNWGARCTLDSTLAGHRAVVLENELLRIAVLASKGTDVVEFLHKPTDTDFMWRAPGDRSAEDLAATRGPNPAGAFLDLYLGGWHEMAPAFAGGELLGASVSAGGELTAVPWKASLVRDDPECVEVSFSVTLRRAPLRFEKRLRLEAGSPSLAVEEEAVNLGGEPVRFNWGHHAVLGPAFIGPDCRIECPGGTVVSAGPEGPGGALEPGTEGEWPFVEDRSGDRLDLSVVRERRPGWEEDVYLPRVGSGWVGVSDPGRGLGFGLAWNPEVFPTLWLWENFGGRPGYPWYGDTYCLGIEFLSAPWEGSEELDRHAALGLDPGERLRTRFAATTYEPEGQLAGITPEGAATFRPR